MQPDNPLHILQESVSKLQGIGPQLEKLFERLCGAKLIDVLFHLPSGFVDRRAMPPIATAMVGEIATFVVTVDRHKAPPRGRRGIPYRITVHDDSGSMDLVFFSARGDYLSRVYPLGAKRAISGRVEMYSNKKQMTHPDYCVGVAQLEEIRKLEPTYGLTAGLTQNRMHSTILQGLKYLPEMPEWISSELLSQKQWGTWATCMKQVHTPDTALDLSPLSPARERLAYDELLSYQYALAIHRMQRRDAPGRILQGNGKLKEQALKNLPYQLTGDQERAIHDITAELATTHKMHRLLQGDVGSGKTIVAFFAMLHAIEAGTQAALMAPTEILAQQHFETLKVFGEQLGLTVLLLTGSVKGKARKETLQAIEDGSADIIIGTHALFQEAVHFKDLGFAVIDEQHRFGVQQRLMLSQKGEGCDTLLMSATPIPRTLLLAYYGDLDVSRLLEKPAGRLPITTKAMPEDRLGDLIDAMKRVLEKGDKVYWICPLIEESEESDMAAAEARFKTLQRIFGSKVALVHGQMKPEEKDAAMNQFASPAGGILVATTVVEVGVDVKDATAIIIEHAERFGLSQLHQLRGRVGRSSKASSCVLLYYPQVSPVAQERLRVMRETNDGFVIAEKDFELRGGGEVLGTRQSGAQFFRLAHMEVHQHLLPLAHKESRALLEQDPKLTTPRGQAVRLLMQLFDKDRTELSG